jgi:hypothetical protein
MGFALLANTPLTQNSVYDRLKHRLEEAAGRGRSTPNRLHEGLSTLALKLKPVSIHPAVSVTTSDVFFATVTLFVWAFIRDLDVGAMLDNSVLSFLTSNKSEKHVEFEDKPTMRALPATDSEEPEELVPVSTPKRRGRPKKSTLTNDTAFSSDLNALKRPTRRGLRTGEFADVDPDDAYEPTAAAKRDVDQMETDGENITDDLVGPSESTALALFLGFIGGLGQVSASVLGAEVTAE